MRNTGFRFLSLLVLAFLIFYACGGGEKSPSGLGPRVSGSEADPSKHFQLTPESVVLHDGEKAVKQVSSDHSVFVLDGSAKGVDQLGQGKVVVIPGVDAGRITEINKTGNDVSVTLGPARITDVIHDGVLEWGPQDMDFSRGTMVLRKAPTVKQARLWGKDSTTAPVFGFENFFVSPAYADATHQVELQVDDYSVIVELSKDTWQLSAKKSKGVEVSISVKVKWIKLETKGHVEVGNGTVTGYNLSAPMSGYIELEVTTKSSEARAFPPQAVIELPVEYIVPVPIYGVPCYAGFKINFLIQPSLSTRNSGISLGLRSDFDGTPCIVYKDGAIDRCAEIKWEKPPDPLSQVTATPSPGALAMVFAVQCPRISFGVGTQSIARGGVFMDMVTSLGVTLFGATAMIPCRQYTLSRSLGAGLEFELGPDLFKKLLKSLSEKVKVKMENKVELASETLHYAVPNVKACQ